MIAALVVGIFILLFGVVVFRGAPYVPTHTGTIKQALALLPLKRGQTVVDLGSGDGAFLKLAAEQGFRAVGYEINPLLCAVAWLRCAPVRSLVTIKVRDFWLTPLPADTSAIFIFLAGPHMKHFARYAAKAMQGRSQPLYIVSNGFAVPGLTPQNIVGGLYLYKLLLPKR